MSIKFDLNDVLLIPAETSYIDSRKEINVKYPDGFLPLFTAPMDTVVSNKNKDIFLSNGINVTLPRDGSGMLSYNPNCFNSYGLDEFISVFLDKTPEVSGTFYALIDIANGHLNKLLLTVEKVKNKYGDQIILMVGNIANPKTYIKLSNAGADFIRLSVGTGSGCLTAVHTGISYPIGSLINEVYWESTKLKNPAKIIADGGIRTYGDAIKALALGADYCMMGSSFNKALESCAPTYMQNMERDNGAMVEADQYSDNIKKSFLKGRELTKIFRGMSTKEVQRSWNREHLRSSEGIIKTHKVEYTIEGWIDNFKDYLSSSMSYCDALNLEDFIGKVSFNLITQNSFDRYNK